MTIELVVAAMVGLGIATSTWRTWRNSQRLREPITSFSKAETGARPDELKGVLAAYLRQQESAYALFLTTGWIGVGWFLFLLGTVLAGNPSLLEVLLGVGIEGLDLVALKVARTAYLDTSERLDGILGLVWGVRESDRDAVS